MTYEERIAEMEKQLADLKAEIKSAEAAPGVWKPKDGEPYFSVWYTGGICKTYVPNEEETEGRLSIGNCFRTKEEAKFAAERLKVLAEMRKYAKGFKPDWITGESAKWCISASGKDRRRVFADHWCLSNYGAPVFFASEDDAKACIAALGEERLLKYYFCEEVPGNG